MQRYDFENNLRLLRQLDIDARHRSTVTKIIFIYNKNKKEESSLQIPDLHAPPSLSGKKEDDYFHHYKNIFKAFEEADKKRYPNIHFKIEKSETNPEKVTLIITGDLNSALKLLEECNYITKKVRCDIHDNEDFKEYLKSPPDKVIHPIQLPPLTAEDYKRLATWRAARAARKAAETKLLEEKPTEEKPSPKSSN